MVLHKLLQLYMFLRFIVSKIESAPNIPQAKPGCPDKCGNISIPFPFGTKEKCYLSKSYFVNCSTVSGRPQINHASVDLVEISLEGHLRVLSPLAHICYNKFGKSISSQDPWVKLSRFPLSLKRNKITTIGCDTRGNIKTKQTYQAGCTTMPRSCDAMNGSCSNVGCCQSSIEPPEKSPTRFRFHVESNQHNVGKEGFNNCSYAFIVEEGYYNYSSVDVYNKQNLESFQMVIDWTVGKTSCKEAQKEKKKYLCKENSSGNDADNGQGYRCSCTSGYLGNPYLGNGCQDVNDCDDPLLNDCTHTCNNTAGNYTWFCPKDYHGDGRKNGTRCIQNETNLQKLGVCVGISVGATVTSLTMVFIYCLVNQRRIIKRREKFFTQNGGMIFQKLLFEYEDSAQIVKIFTEEELKKATNNFNQKQVLGQGGYGTVYRGMLVDNTVVAIKRLKVIDRGQIDQFVNKVVILSQINHPNVVKPLGCCLETQVPLLVYEFITNAALFHHLHGKDRGSSMTWKMRLDVELETANALAHMHLTTQIIHRDIKSSNILLTDEYTAKVSDFGISRFVPMDKTHLSTAVQGTVGYIDPEYFRMGILTEKSDVYSFGVVLVELLTAEKVHSLDRSDRNKALEAYFLSSLEDDCLIKVLDDQVKKDRFSEDGCSKQHKRVAQLAKSCLDPEVKKRPTMEEVKEELVALRNFIISSDS